MQADGLRIEPWLDDAAGPPGHPDHPDDPAPRPATGPTLYLVPADADPPPCADELEDWIRLPIDIDELRLRADRLMARAQLLGAVPIDVDDDGVLRVGSRLVILSPLEARLVRLLLARRGELVTRDQAVAAMWPDGPPADPRALDNRVKNLRARISALPIRLSTVRARGLILEWVVPSDGLGRGAAS
jgi:hypothetical protein